MSTPSFDVVVIGGGIVGVAAARAIALNGGHRVLVVEAEPRLAAHQTGRNSGVIHSGLYYRPDSDKARLCTKGRHALFAYCEKENIPHRRCGKLVVATDESQIPAIEELERRGLANGLGGLQRLDSSSLRDREPAVRGLAGLWVPETGIVDFAEVTRSLAREIQERDGEILLGAKVRKIRRQGGRIQIQTQNNEIHGRLLVNCAGLQSDRVARLAGLDPQIRLIPFRGEYYQVQGEARQLVRSLIYPVPDARFPFLGVHLTRTIDERVLAGPNALPAFKREGYRRTDCSVRDLLDTLSFPGFWRLAGNFWRTALAETRRSLNKRAFCRETQRLVPGITERDLGAAPSGVRAQAVDRSGTLLDDFFILRGAGMIHVLNAPSPAATAALAIGDHIASLAEQDL